MSPVNVLSEPSINKTGNIVTFMGTEYRWRDGAVYMRDSVGNLLRVNWLHVPLRVRSVFTECQS